MAWFLADASDFGIILDIVFNIMEGCCALLRAGVSDIDVPASCSPRAGNTSSWDTATENGERPILTMAFVTD